MRTILSFCQGLPENAFGPGETLLSEGGSDPILYVLIAGELEILKGDFQINLVAEPGAIFGEITVLLGIPHTATVKALTPVRVYRIDHASEFLQSHTDVAYQLARLLAQRLHGVTTYLVDLKNQFEEHDDHLGMVDEVLETLVHQQDEECAPGSERDPNPTI